jgi:hypothetical protein
MRLSELAFPIAVLREDSLCGGNASHLGRMPHFFMRKASACLNGYYDNAVIYDSTGRKLVIEAIELRKPPWLHRIARKAGHLFIFPDNDWDDLASIDMVLRQIGLHTLETFRTELRDIALGHPEWWKRFTTAEAISERFEAPTSISDIIENIGTLEQKRLDRLPGRSTKCQDMR